MGIFTRPIARDEDNNITAAPYSAPRAITAAASRISLKDKNEIESLKNRRLNAKWQQQAWEYYDLIGEVKYAANLVGSVISRIRLFSALVIDENMAPSPLSEIKGVSDELKQAAASAMRLLGTGTGGISGFLQDAALNLFITGECYIVQQPARPGLLEGESWQIRSVDELVVNQATARTSNFAIRPRSDSKISDYIPLPKHAFVGRMWKMHPRFSDEADSSMRGLLELMDELLLLSKDARATIKSRLNSGIFLLPDGLSDTSQGDGDIEMDGEKIADMSDDESESFEEEFERAMVTPIADEGSASSVVPLVLRGPAELLQHIRHISISRTFDAKHTERAKEVLDRILAGLDIPKEVVAGLSDSKYANATVVEESLLRNHVEPMILQIVDALTVVFLRPVLRSLGFKEEEISDIVIWYDPSMIATKPSKADAATKGYENRAISAKAWRRSNGFHDSDAPTELEIAQRLAVERGLLSEPVTEALLRTLIPELLESVRQDQLAQSGDGPDILEKINGEEIPAPNAPEEGATPTIELIEP